MAFNVSNFANTNCNCLHNFSKDREVESERKSIDLVHAQSESEASRSAPFFFFGAASGAFDLFLNCVKFPI